MGEPGHSPICVVCGQSIAGGYYRDVWGQSACREHGVPPTCFNCHRFVGEGGQHLQDGRHLCARCIPSVVSTDQHKQWAEEKVRSMLAQSGITDLGRNVVVHISNAASVNFIVNLKSPKPSFLGVASSESRRMGDKVQYRHRINVLNGLHKVYFAAVLGHEFLHCWQRQHDIRLPRQIEEGFCELGCYRVLSLIGTPLARYHIGLMETNRDPDYGDGFRLVRTLAESNRLTLLPDVMRLLLRTYLYSDQSEQSFQRALTEKHHLGGFYKLK